jgi:hypothetical protein
LTDEEKAFNQQLARRRVRIEHVNSSVKRCRGSVIQFSR